MKIKTVHRLAATGAAIALMCAGLWCVQSTNGTPLSQVAYAEEKMNDFDNKDAVALDIIAKPLRTQYMQGDDFDLNGLTVAARNSSNMRHIVPLSDLLITGYDSQTASMQTIKVALKDNPSISTAFMVHVLRQPIVQKTYTITTLASNSSDHVVMVNNNQVTVDLSKVPVGTTDVTVARNSLGSATNSIVFSHGSVDGHGLNLNIDDWALAQQEGQPTLASVVFPDGLNSLKIGRSAFFQYSADGSTALVNVRFPYSLKSLTIGNSAFRQDAYQDATLHDVNLPEHVENLSIGSLAFHQKYNRAGALHSVTLPAGMKSLRILPQAFSVTPSFGAMPTLQSVFLAADMKGVPQNTVLGAFVTRTGSPLHAEPQPVWQYLDDNSTISAVFNKNAKISPTMQNVPVQKGTLLTYDPNYGNDLNGVMNMPPAQGLVHNGTQDMQNVAFVPPVRNANQFLGWNTRADGSGMMIQPGQPLNVKHSEMGVVLYAQWKQVEQPKPTQPAKPMQPTKPMNTNVKHHHAMHKVIAQSHMHHQMTRNFNMLAYTGAAVSIIVVIIVAAIGIAAVLFYGRHKNNKNQISHEK